MILLERWILAVVLSVGLVSTGSALGQSSSAKRQPPPVEAATPDRATADRAQPDQPPADQAKPEEPAADQASDQDQAKPEEPAADQASDQDQAKPEEPAADQAASDQAKPEEPAADQAASDQAKPEEPAADQAASEPAADQAASEPAKPDQPAANQPAAKQMVAIPPATPEEQQLQNETTRLLQLVQELKVEVAKAGSNTLSLAAVRKADEVLKLSKDLKERMKDHGPVPQSRAQ
jgi:hypothetical protein